MGCIEYLLEALSFLCITFFAHLMPANEIFVGCILKGVRGCVANDGVLCMGFEGSGLGVFHLTRLKYEVEYPLLCSEGDLINLFGEYGIDLD